MRALYQSLRPRKSIDGRRSQFKMIQQIDEVLSNWCQGDVCCDPNVDFVHLADLARPHSAASRRAAQAEAKVPEGAHESRIKAVSENKIEGFVILTQTCDLVRQCQDRPYVEVAPLIKVSQQVVEDTRRWKRLAFAYIPCKARDGLVADLDRIMTVEKAVVAKWTRIPGCNTDRESRDFREVIGKKRSRFPFPDDFVEAVKAMRNRLLQKHKKDSEEGDHLRALREIRVLATPSWDAVNVRLKFIFVKNKDPQKPTWKTFIMAWLSKFNANLRFDLAEPTIVDLSELTAQDYLNSERLDLESVSIDPKPK